jgi:DNA-binding transcriptional LysR family regulator
MGIVLRPSFSLGDDLAAGRLLRLLPEYHLGQLSAFLVYPSRRLLSAKVRSFVDFMIEKFPRPDIDPWLTPHLLRERAAQEQEQAASGT